MVTGPAPAPSRRVRDLLVRLFDEALRLERRRRRRYLLMVLVAACLAAGAVRFVGSGGGGPELGGAASAANPPRLVVGSLTLPALGGYPMLSVVGKRLFVTDAEDTRVVDARVRGSCAAASVDPATLHLISVARGSCGNPALFAQHVIPVSYVPSIRNHRGWGVNALAMRISVVDRSTASGYRLGPVIVTYPNASDTRAETIEGDGSLWVFAPTLGPRLSYGELLRVSLRTGRVVERWRMPPITRALLATNADGLWLAPSNESGFSEHASAAERVEQSSLYHVAPGMHAPARVFDVGIWGARWLVAHGHSVWLARGRASRPPALWRFAGPIATPIIRGARTTGAVRTCGDLGDGSVTVTGSTAGIFCLSNPNPNTQHVQWLSPTGGRSSVVARIPTGGAWEFADNAVVYSGSYYFVEPTGRTSPQFGRPVLYRVGPRRR
jgi:hypothetical protein